MVLMETRDCYDKGRVELTNVERDDLAGMNNRTLAADIGESVVGEPLTVRDVCLDRPGD